MSRAGATGGAVTDAAALDAEWVRTRLGWPVDARSAVVAVPVPRADGAMGAVHSVTCEGRSFVLKAPPTGSDGWSAFVRESGIVAREIEAYRYLTALVHGPRVTPRLYWSTLDDGGLGALAIEEVPGDPTGSMSSGLTRRQAVAAVECLARAHRTLVRPGADAATAELPWLLTARSEELLTALRLGLDDVPDAVADWPADAADRVSSRAAQAAGAVAELARAGHLGAGLVGLCHGDAWVGNVLFTDRGLSRPAEAVLIDWQFAMWGNPLSDVALLLLSSVAPAARGAWTRPLLRRYHATLHAHAGLDYPWATCQEDYRRALPFAALVATATLGAYTNAVDGDLSGLATRIDAATEHLVPETHLPAVAR